jgi:hypothetical protein
MGYWWRVLRQGGVDNEMTSGDTEPPYPSRTAGSDDANVHVLYMAGIGRSGSTLLCRTLGAADGFVGTGELMRILGRGAISGDLCSCEVPVPECEFWRRVLDELHRRRPNLDLERLEWTRKRVTEGWEFLRYLFQPLGRTALGRDLGAYRDFLAALYPSIAAVSGNAIVVDASKNLLFGTLLTETPGLTITMLHLVRDSRGVAHSLQRKQERPGTRGRREYFRQQGPWLGSILWSTAHVTSEWLGRRTVRVIRVRYEDFVADPSSTLSRIFRELGLPERPDRIPHVNGGSVRLGVDHLIASNPNRSRRGEVALREDTAWRHEMSAGRRWLVTGMTFPLLHRYGYTLAGQSRPEAEPGGITAEQPEQ